MSVLPGACFVLERRQSAINAFSEELLGDPKLPVMVWKQGNLAALDGVFDVLVCQTAFGGIEAFSKTRIAMIQYGYAKEPHNYGAWRAFADLNLTYGPYAADKIANFSPVVVSGNPRYDDWFFPEFHLNSAEKYRQRLDSRKQTVLYAPTWGDLSSVDSFMAAVHELSNDFNVLIKMHHNTDLLESARRGSISGHGVCYLGANDDLLELMSIADVVISDYSGAIFDAMFCRKPLVLLNAQVEVMSNKIDVHSLEYARREEIGLQVARPYLLRPTVAQALQAPGVLLERSAALRNELFVDKPGATERAASAIVALAQGEFVRGQMQSYVRKEMIAFYQTKTKLTAASRKLKTACTT